MKLTFTLSIVLLSIYLISLTDAGSGRRKKRALYLEMCPINTTYEECDAFAKEESKKIQFCHTYNIHNFLITWASCGVIACTGNTKVKEEDLSKPYPYCCKTCVMI